MSSRKSEIADDLIDFSNNFAGNSISTHKPSNGIDMSTNPYSSPLLDQSLQSRTSYAFDFVDEGKPLTLDDYMRKPRAYSRERSPSNEERPPPLPPKRRIQSRKNQKLTNRLLNAGIDVKDDHLLSPHSSFDDPAVSKSKICSEKRLSSLNLNDSGYSASNFTPTYPSRTFETPKDFDSKLRKSLAETNADLLQLNLMEFESSLKPPAKTNRPLPSNLTNNRSSSLDNLLKIPEKPPISSLSMEDLEAFMSDLPKISTNSPSDPQNSKLNFIKHSKFLRTSTLPPARPEPPKIFNRLSLPSDVSASKENDPNLYFGDGIFDLAEERNNEAMEFCTKIAEIRQFYNHDNPETNPGIISDAVIKFDNPGWHRTIEVEVFYEEVESPVNLLCDVFSKVQDVVMKALLKLQDRYRDIDTISKNKYIFKVCGKSCYLEGNEPFINYSYVQNCVKLGKKISVIVMARVRIKRDLSRSKEDDEQESKGIYFKQFFKINSSTAISRQGLSVLIDTYNCEVENLISNIEKTRKPTYVPEKLIQVVKALSLSLACLESTQLHQAVNLLLSLKPKTKDAVVINPKEHDIIDFNRIISNETFDKGRFKIALEKLTSAVFALIDSYCKAFDTDFAINDPRSYNKDSFDAQMMTNERASSGTIRNKFSIRICSAHRIPNQWKAKYDYFEVQCGIFYGGKCLCDQVLTKLSRLAKGFCEHLQWDETLKFDVEVKEIPREAKICIGLYGFASVKKQRDTRNRTELGWISCNLFDFRGILISGSQLFGLISETEMNPAATCSSSSIQEQSSVILRADFEIYHTEVIFPETLVQTAPFLDYLDFPANVIDEIQQILNKGSYSNLVTEEKELLWRNRFSLRSIDKALPFVLSSVPDLRPGTLKEAQEIAQIWETLSSDIALGLLTAGFPDIVVRTCAVNWFSIISESELCDYLPQLVQALKFETYHSSALSKFLITSGLKNPRIAHYLFWHLKYYTADAQFSQRFQIILGGLLGVCGAAMKDQFSRQDLMVQQLAKTTHNVKETKDNLRRSLLTNDLGIIAAEIDGCLRLPVDPSIEVKGIISDSCSYFNSFTVPLSIVYENSDVRGKYVKTMFKVGDDLRKDLVTLQLFRVMNRLWLSESLDLNMITYECMPTAPLAGMVQLVPNAVTLREIHIQHGVTGSFKEDVIGLWLQKYNQSEGDYQTAVENFSASCAAYCVATYVLGIGDRHNDNIMVTQKGHLFHIDFSKFMGNVQKFGTIRRDRVPFVLTPDMAFVINFGDSMSHNFQHFIELCCDAFNVIRKNSELILNLLGLMVSSGIPYLSSAGDIEYVRHALQLHLTDAQATVFFTRLIETSLSSKSTQWNFFIHNMAHVKDSQNPINSARAIFSFSNKVYSKESDGEILSVRCVDIQKRYVPDKHYIFVLNVLRNDNLGPRFIFRKFDEFQELHSKLSQVFGSSMVPSLPGRVLVGRSEIRDIAMKRRFELDEFLVQIMGFTEFANSEIIYTFLHSYIRDEQDSFKFADILMKLEQGLPRSRVGGEIKLSFQYSNNQLNILVMHARNLVPRTIQGTADPYVKSYLVPDPSKSTKRKTRIARKNLNPTYNQTLSYEAPMEQLQQRTLQVTVWDNDAMGVNSYLGGVNVYLCTRDLTIEKTQWYELRDLGLGM